MSMVSVVFAGLIVAYGDQLQNIVDAIMKKILVIKVFKEFL